jgi:hypothetical protein
MRRIKQEKIQNRHTLALIMTHSSMYSRHTCNYNIRIQGDNKMQCTNITVGIVRLGPGVDGVDISVGVDEHGENGEHFSASTNQADEN